MYRKLLLLLALLNVMGCGEAMVGIDDRAYEAKIVIHGWLFPGHPVTDIKIMRNFPLNADIRDRSNIVISNARVRILDDQGLSYSLAYNAGKEAYEYHSADLRIEHGRTYTLEVQATVEGQDLFAKSTTTVPKAGFRILEASSVLGSMTYRERDSNGELKNFQVVFERSPDTDFYALSLTALNADVSTFIYDNPFGDYDEEDVLNDFDDFRLVYSWIQDTPLTVGESSIDVLWFFTWFYGRYQAIVYAADRNFKDFLITHDDVQEIDGNFHEPSFHIEGDGIGVFGSAIADTAFFEVRQN